MLDELVHDDFEIPQSPEPARPLWGRILKWLAAIIAGLLVVFHVAGAWYFSGIVRDDALSPGDSDGPDYTVTVLAVDAGTITLDRSGDNVHLEASTVVGMAWPGGYGQIGDVVALTDTTVVRSRIGDWLAPSPGTLVDLDGYAFAGTPWTALGLDFAVTSYPGPLGDQEAWYLPGTTDTWVVFVHGKGAPLREALRMLPAALAGGHHGLVISYRNDPGSPPDPSGWYRYGAAEWADLEAAVDHAVAGGAASIVLVGYSMGGAIVAAYLEHSDHRAAVAGIILDAPLLDLGAAVDAGARDESVPVIGTGVPRTLVAAAKWVTALRFDVDWSDLDYASRAEAWDVPVLLFHGNDDDTAPIEVSREVAEARLDLVEFHPIPGAGHVQSWNRDPESYAGAVTAFVGRIAGD